MGKIFCFVLPRVDLVDQVNLEDLFLHHVLSHLSVPSFQTNREDQPPLGLLFDQLVPKALDIHLYPKIQSSIAYLFKPESFYVA